MRRLSLVVSLAACNSATLARPPSIDRVEPPYGPLSGGTEVAVQGAGFLGDDAAPNRVLIGGREAPLVRTADDATLHVVLPAGDQPGDAELVVLNRNGNTAATGVFHYSTPPAITGAAPTEVVYTATDAVITLTGAGFLDEGAGDVRVLVDGQLIPNVAIASDTSLSFIAPTGRPLLRPEITVVNDRGLATMRRGFRYAPSPYPGLLLFPTNGGAFGVFFDPAHSTSIWIPWASTVQVRYSAVVRDEVGDYWAFDRLRRFGRIDTRTHLLENPITTATVIPTLTPIGGNIVGIDRNARRFGKLDPATGAFSWIGTAQVPCCGSFAIASDGTTTYFTAREGTAITINTVDHTTGTVGTPVTLTGAGVNLHVEEMRFFDGVLYATSRDSTLVTIDPATGVTTVLPVSLGRAGAMERYP